MTAEPGRRCAVLGSPIAHSLSPALHQAAYLELGLDWHYDRFEVDEEGLAGFVAGLDPSYRGLSLTMPLKAAALELGEVEPLAALAGAANTVVLERDGRRRLRHRTPSSGPGKKRSEGSKVGCHGSAPSGCLWRGIRAERVQSSQPGR